jgi:hypothetical protein
MTIARRVSALKCAVTLSRPIQPEHSGRSIERDAEIAEIVGWPERRIHVDTDHPVDQERRPAASPKAQDLFGVRSDIALQ